MRKEKLFTIAEAAQVWKVGPQRARDIIKSENVKVQRYGATKRYVRVPESEVSRIKAAREVPTHIVR